MVRGGITVIAAGHFKSSKNVIFYLFFAFHLPVIYLFCFN